MMCTHLFALCMTSTADTVLKHSLDAFRMFDVSIVLTQSTTASVWVQHGCREHAPFKKEKKN